MTFDDPGLLAEFVTESLEHLADVESQLLEIESGGADIDVDLVNTVFRAVHSIKGVAGFMGLVKVNTLSHHLENVLGKIRNQELVPNAGNVDVMLRSADVLRNMINDVENSNDVDVSGFVQELDAIEKGATSSQAPSTPESVAAECDSSAEPESCNTDDQTTSAESTTQVAASGPPSAKAPKLNVESSVRVPVGVLDQLMNLAGELVLGRNQLLQNLQNTEQNTMQSVASRLDHVTSELQDAIMRTRMQPIGNVFNKFPRVIRDLSAKLGKKCSVSLEGQDVDVDKTIIEAIGDPLAHMIRNSIDHGIESPETRKAAGKHEEGHVTLRAYHQAGKLRIDVIDDGKGIDGKRLKQSALDKGIISEERAERMSEREAVWLIFHPGFSTAEKLSDVSGRGVGMDVVRTNIEKIGGQIDIESQVGKGTKVGITLPLTLAIIPTMLVTCQSRRFAIPQINIVELVRIRQQDLATSIQTVKNSQLLRLRDSLLPLVDLDEAIGLPKREEESGSSLTRRYILVVESGHLRYGLTVDGIVDSEEIVVKPLGRHLRDCQCLAGAAILGDGQIAPILDITGIATIRELAVSESDQTESTNEHDHGDFRERHSMLLLSNSPSEFFAVPMSMIARIEQIKKTRIEDLGGQKILKYQGTTLPLLMLDRHIEGVSAIDSDTLHVVIFSMSDREVGLVVNQIHDICDVSSDFDGTTFRQNGVSGSFMEQDHVVRLLDLYELTQVAYPNIFARHAIIDAEECPPKILLAEDSLFFRNKATEYLESLACEVTACEDGKKAWDVLNEHPDEFDLLLTDIEMPRINGLELTRRVRASDRWNDLPIIALTSLSSEEDRQRGLEAGVDDYQVKIDREKVVSAVNRLLKRKSDRRPDESNQLTEEPCLV